MKSVLLSIQPKWCELIARGKKTVEVRKTKPKLKPPFKCYIYMTKPKERLLHIMKDGDENYGEVYHGKPVFIKTKESSWHEDLYGKEQKVIGEFVCDSIEWVGQSSLIVKEDAEKALEGSCLTREEIFKYLVLPRKQGDDKYRECYGWHISNLVIYDKPKELSKFEVVDNKAVKQCKYRERTGQPESCTQHGGWIKGSYICTKDAYYFNWCENCKHKPIVKPPQSWCYVEELK